MIRTTKTLAVLLFSVLLAVAASAQDKITGFSIAKESGGIVITVKGAHGSQPTTKWIASNKTLMVNFNGVLVGKAASIRVNSNGITTARLVQFTAKPPVVRLALGATNEPKPTFQKSEIGWTVAIGKSATPAPTTESAIVANAEREDAKMFEEALSDLSNGIVETIAKQVETVSEITKSAVLALNDSDKEKAKQGGKTKQPEKDPFGPIGPLEPAINIKAPPTGQPGSRVTLEFHDADVRLVLKALADQTGANIVVALAGSDSGSSAAPPTGGGVEGQVAPVSNGGGAPKVTISLRNVTVDEALDLITAIANLRYTRVGTTYVVTNREAYHETMAQLANRVTGANEVRVVPIVSRQGGQIKQALLRWFGPTVLQIVLPSDTGSASGPAQPVNTGAQNGAGEAQGEGGGQPAANRAVSGGDDYILLIGAKKWVDEAEKLARDVDNSLAEMYGLYTTSGVKPITMAYKVKGGFAEDLASALRTYIGVKEGDNQAVTIAATPKTSRADQQIVLTGRPAEVNRLVEVLAQIDTVGEGGEMTYYVYEVRHSDPRSLKEQVTAQFPALSVAIGPEGAAGLSYTGPGGGAVSATSAPDAAKGANVSGTPIYDNREFTAKPMKLVLGGAKRVIDEALSFLGQVDKPVPKLAIEARVMELTKEEAVKAGIDWNILSGGIVQSIRLNNSQPAGSDGSPFNTGKFSLWGEAGGENWTTQITATLDKLANKNNLIARPNVTTQDGREAVVFIGEIVRYIKAIQATQNGITVEVGEEEVGVKLNVLPRIGGGDTITLDVQPTLSFIRSFLDVPGGGQIPITSIRTARSALTIRNGETIAIGGLINEGDRREVSGIPILMDIPIIGQLFRRTSETKVKSEIVIFITARIVPTEDAEAKPGAGAAGSKGG